jgi:hypothetical protein
MLEPTVQTSCPLTAASCAPRPLRPVQTRVMQLKGAVMQLIVGVMQLIVGVMQLIVGVMQLIVGCNWRDMPTLVGRRVRG